MKGLWHWGWVMLMGLNVIVMFCRWPRRKPGDRLEIALQHLGVNSILFLMDLFSYLFS